MPRTPKVGLKDIAAEARISVSAASMALADHPRISADTRRRVRDISDRLGYSNARRANGRPLHGPYRIGLVVIDEDLSRPNNGAILMQLTSLVPPMGMRLEAVGISHDQPHDRQIEQMLRSPEAPQALILSGHTEALLYRAIAQVRVPSVTLGDPLVNAPVDSVNFDHAAAGRYATAYLLAQGHRRVGFICDTMIPRGANTRALDGYRLAHADADAPLDPRLIHATKILDGGLSTVPDALLRGPAAPSAYLVVNTNLADAVIAALRGFRREATVVPVRLKEIHLASGAPGPALLYPLRTMCQVALERLVYLYGRPDQAPQQILVPFETQDLD